MKKWKLIMVVATALIAFSISSMVVFADTNVVTDKTGVKVFVGAISQNSSLTRNSFVKERSSLILENSKNNPQEENTALITFSDYLTVEETDNFISTLENCKVKQIFLGIPHTDGRTIIGKNGADTIVEHVEKSFNSMLAEEQDNEIKNHLTNYKNNSLVFAITVESSNATLAKAVQMQNVNFVDVYNYPGVEQAAKKNNISVSYIPVPEKPDNSH